MFASILTLLEFDERVFLCLAVVNVVAIAAAITYRRPNPSTAVFATTLVRLVVVVFLHLALIRLLMLPFEIFTGRWLTLRDLSLSVMLCIGVAAYRVWDRDGGAALQQTP